MEAKKRKLDVVVISDIHLGTFGAQAGELADYLNSIDIDILVLNGDIIDIWQFNKRYFPNSHMAVIRAIFTKLSKGTKVHYITGNHDEMLRKFNGFSLGDFTIQNKIVLNLPTGKAWIFHGDVFDTSMKQSKWIVKLGGFGYDLLIRINSIVNWCSERMGRGRVSLSKKVKDSVKGVISYINNFEETVAEIAISKGYEYVICGHIHQPTIQEMTTKDGRVHYLNSGDWIENRTALEYVDGTWSLYTHQEKKTKREQKPDEKNHLDYEHLYNDVILDNSYSLNLVEL
jgi:UDP-2,3-diacylglucosamine pyrophosphatase LpxH